MSDKPIDFIVNDAPGTIEATGDRLWFKCGICVHLDTGEVAIPEGLPLSDAARQFWTAVASFRRTG